MAINNNTNRLGTGFRARVTGRDFSDPNAAAISGEIARQNYRATFKSDYKLKRLRQYVSKMVSRYSPSDKMAILAEYGDPRRGRSDEAVVEALITNLRESDLELLVKDVMVDEGNLSKRVREIRKARQRQGSRFSTKSFAEVYEMARSSRNPRELQKAINAYDRSFKIPKSVASQFRPLGREINKVLNDIYNQIELTGLAMKMEISFEDNTSKKELISLITNKVLLFVSLVTGRTKAGYAAAIVNDAPYKEVLQYTSYAWAAGVSGTTPDGLKSLRQQAREAKARSRESFIQRSRGTERFFGNRQGENRNVLSAGLDILNPLKAPGRILGAAATLPAALIGGLLSLGQKETGVSLGSLGGGLLGGIGGAFEWLLRGFRGPGMMAGARAGAEAGRGINAQNAASFALNPFNFGQRRLENEAAANVKARGAVNDYLTDMSAAELLDEGAKYGIRARPLDTPEALEGFRRDIRVKIEQLRIRRRRLEKRQAELAKKGKTLSESERGTLGAITGQLKEIGAAGEKFEYQGSTKIPYIKFSLIKGIEDIGSLKAAVPVFVVNSISDYASGGSEAEKLEQKNKTIAAAGYTTAAYEKEREDLSDKIRKRQGFGGGMSLGSIKELGSKLFDEKTGIKGFQAGEKSSDLSSFVSMKLGGVKGMVASDKDYVDLSKPAEALITTGTRALRVVDVSPVLQSKIPGNNKKAMGVFSQAAVNLGVNKLIPEAARPVYVVNNSVQTDTGRLLLGVAKMFLNFIPGGKLISGQLDSLAGSGDDIASIVGLATGGTGRAAGLGRKTTHFISGDSLSKRPNPEQVSINWSDKSYSVKPIPQFAEGGGQSASGQVRRMTPGERNEPMKVYAVNNSLTEMVEVNGQSVSLIGLVSEMNGRLGTIEGLLAIGNSNSAAIVKSTALTATSISRISAPQSGSNNLNPFAGGGFPSDLNPILSGA